MSEKKGKKKRPAAHQVAIELLRENTGAHFSTLEAMYKRGTVVPAKGIPGLIDAFKNAGRIIAGSQAFVKDVIQILHEQHVEAKKKGQGEEAKEVSEGGKVADRVYKYFVAASEGKKVDKEKLIGDDLSEAAADEVHSLCEVVDFLAALRNVKRKRDKEKSKES